MKKISIAIMLLVVALASCKKTPEVNLKYVDVERDLITVGTTTATVQCDYQYIATLKKAYLYYGEGENEADMNTAEMRVVQNTLYVDLTGLKSNTLYSYYYEFHNGFNSMRTALKTFKTEGGSGPAIILPTVVTGEVTEITTSSAKGSGEVTNNGGAEVAERGICWSTNENPTLSNNYVAAGTGTGAFTAMMNDLEEGITYHVRAYATNEVGTAYGLDREFVTDGGGGCDYEYVDLGLPSGTLWATCNVGANSPEEYGCHFAWGETEEKARYTFETYKYSNGDQISITKYCNNPNYGYNGFTDNLTILEAGDDAATVNWCDDWCMPTVEQFSELFENTFNIWTTINGVGGRLFTANNGNSIFFPAAGFYTWDDEPWDVGAKGYYWSKSLFTDPDGAWKFGFYNGECEIVGHNRADGHSVRPVRKNDSPIPPTPPDVPEGAINGLFTINENGDQVYFSQGNLQYQASTNTWRFAEHQWDYVGGMDEQGIEYGNVYENGNKCDNLLLSSSYNGWIDLFGWGTSGYHDMSDQFNVFYHPWNSESITINPDYNLCGYGPSTNMPSTSLIGSSANYDWGVYNAIINGGNVTNKWRTLSKEEWEYIFDFRYTNSGVRFAKSRVCGLDGVIILPDNWVSSNYNLINANVGEASFDSNEITLTVWDESFGIAGAVFLPASGVRYQMSDIFYGGREVHYWSSSDCIFIGEIEDYSGCTAFSVYVLDDSFYASGNVARDCGRSVRLVQDAN